MFWCSYCRRFLFELIIDLNSRSNCSWVITACCNSAPFFFLYVLSVIKRPASSVNLFGSVNVSWTFALTQIRSSINFDRAFGSL